MAEDDIMKFRFDIPGAAESNLVSAEETIYVPPGRLYGEISSDGKPDYGFLTEKNRKRIKRLQIPEINSGLDTVYWYRGTEITELTADQHGCRVTWAGEGEIPLTFATDVPGEGNYQVRIVLHAEAAAEAFLFLGRRRLAWRGSLSETADVGAMHLMEDGNWEGCFVTNICPIIPRTFTEPMEDLTLDVTLFGRGVSLLEVELTPWTGRTVYIAGDSTVTDQNTDYPYLPGSSYCGWGQMLSAYLGGRMAVSNHAHSGLTTESFRSEGHYQILLDRITEGDICLMQFAHNDQKLMHLMAEGGYRENLIRYIGELRQKGAIPVLVTPLARNSWRGDDGTYNDLLLPYAAACMRIAEEYHVPVLPLHQKSVDFIKLCGRDRAMRYFYPSDYTHTNDYGAYLFAGYVYEAMCEYKMSEVGKTGITERWVPPEEMPRLTVPEGFEDMEDPEAEHLFEDLERPDDVLTRVEALQFVITTMHFFPTNVYNDMFEDVIGHETYAGVIECAWQNGLIPENMIEGRRFLPQRKITGGEFLRILRNGYMSRKTWTKEHERAVMEGISSEKYIRRCEAAGMCRRSSI